MYRKDGTKVEVRLGEEAGDPVFCVTDLLPHLGAEQNKRTLADGLREMCIRDRGVPACWIR